MNISNGVSAALTAILGCDPHRVRQPGGLHAHKLFYLSNDAIDLLDEINMIAVLAKRGGKRAIIPKSAVLFPAEPFEHFGPMPSQVS